MKKLVLIFLLCSTATLAQQRIDEYKDYKPCTDCFNQFKSTNQAELDSWKKSGLANYGIPPQTKRVQSQFRQRVDGVLGGVALIFITALTYSVYNQANKAASGIH